MKFLRLPDPLLQVLFENEDIIAIDKPYGFNAHTNDSKSVHAEFIQDGLIEIYEKNLKRPLHVIHRLDQTTTGVMIFGKSVESAKKYAAFFLGREVKKTYLFVTKKRSIEKNIFIDQVIIHKAKELDAQTQFQFLKSRANFSLWQAHPKTGRNHQIRIHAQAAGLSLLGDTKYGGDAFAFLCLHNHRIEFPHGIVIESKPPAYFEDLSLLEEMKLAQIFFEIDRRSRIYGKNFLNENLRLAQTSDYELDLFESQLVVSWRRPNGANADEKRLSRIAETLGLSLVTKAIPAGLSNSQRLQQAWVRENARGLSVLQLFAQSAGFALNASLGGSAHVTVVELGKNNLENARKNFEKNAIDPAAYTVLSRDSLTYLQQIQKKEILFDLIICEVPSFFRGEKRIFKIEKDLEGLLESWIRSLKPGGALLFSTLHDDFFIDSIREMLMKIKKSRGLGPLEINCILAALDHEWPDEKTRLKSFLVRRRGVFGDELPFMPLGNPTKQ